MLKSINFFTLLLALIFSVGTLSASEECSGDFSSEITPDELLESYETDEGALDSTPCSTLAVSKECSEDFWSEITPDELSKSHVMDDGILNSVSCNTRGDTVLHIAARYTPYPGVIEVLTLAEADINAENEEGQSVLEYASDNDNPLIYESVLEAVETSIDSADEVSFDKKSQKNTVRNFQAQEASKTSHDKDKRGWYVGLHSGMTVPVQKLNVDFLSPDLPTNCDFFLVGVVPDSQDCSSSDIWSDVFKPGNGVTTGASFGYAWKNLRSEVELSYQTQSGSLGGTGGYEDLHPEASKSAEFVQSWQAMKSITSKTAAGNLYYDFNELPIGKIRPFVGAGLGVSALSMDYTGVWHRNPDPWALAVLAKTPQAAGTLSAVRSQNLSDKSLTSNFMLGFDFPISRKVSIGAEGRYTQLINGGFYQDVESYDVLRSHPSRVRPSGDLVGYSVGVPDYKKVELRVSAKFYLGKKRGRNKKK